MATFISAGNPNSAFDVAVMAILAMAGEQPLSEAGARRAIEYTDRALAMDPRSASMHLLRGTMFYALGDVHAAVRDINRATALSPSVSDRTFSVEELQRSASARKAFQRLLSQSEAARFPGEFVNPASNVDLGCGLIGGKSMFSVPDWTRVIQREPKSSIAYFMRGLSAFKTAQVDQGLYDVEQSLRLSSMSPDQYFSMVESWMRRFPPLDRRTMPLVRAVTKSAKEEDQAAVQILTDLVNRHPDFYTAQGELAWILATSSDPTVRNGRLALTYAQHAVSREPSARNTRALAAAYADTGDFVRAQKEQRIAIDRARAEGGAREDFRVYLLAYEIGNPWTKTQ